MKDKTKKIIEFIFEFAKNIEIKIQELEEFNNLPNEEKKKRLDEFALMLIIKGIDALPINMILKYSLKWFFTNHISAITQVIYNLIKTKIDGITK